MDETTNHQMRGQRTYYVSDERLREFAKLSYAERLAWVEKCSTFVRLGQAALGKRVQTHLLKKLQVVNIRSRCLWQTHDNHHPRGDSMRSVLVFIFGAALLSAACAQDTPEQITNAQINAYRLGLETGCKNAGRRRGDDAQKVDGFCGCMLEVLNKSMSPQDWQKAYFYSIKKQEREEMLVMRPHMSKIQTCRSGT
ncbi:MAG: hypothetical protein RLZZ271_1487 [Pseudomonadota bacterium]